MQIKYSSWDLPIEEGMICWVASEVYNAPLSIKELHEFLTVEGKEPTTESYGLRAEYILKTGILTPFTLLFKEKS